MQENPDMHNGHPCEDLYPDEYFEDGITNGANWYNVPGNACISHFPFSLATLIFSTEEVRQSNLVQIFTFNLEKLLKFVQYGLF